jgi:hypothetical protein
MALLDILTPDGDIQNAILEIPLGTLNAPHDMLSDTGIEELILVGGNQVTTGYGGG